MACVALADGAGSRARSEIGAETVVRATLRMLISRFDDIFEMCVSANETARQHIYRGLLRSLKRASTQHKCSVSSMASTLLFVAHKEDRFLAGHIGDGVIARVDKFGASHTLSPPDNGEFANTTVFVTDSNAIDRFRLFHGGPDLGIAGFVVMSDGCAESLYDKRTGNPAVAVSKLLAWNQLLSRTKMDAILSANLEQTISKKSSDDCSLALMSVGERTGVAQLARSDASAR